jgi:hypothetical protein
MLCRRVCCHSLSSASEAAYRVVHYLGMSLDCCVCHAGLCYTTPSWATRHPSCTRATAAMAARCCPCLCAACACAIVRPVNVDLVAERAGNMARHGAHVFNVCSMNYAKASMVSKCVACPDTICSTRPAPRPRSHRPRHGSARRKRAGWDRRAAMLAYGITLHCGYDDPGHIWLFRGAPRA